jgi:hypothetical protein
MVSVDIRGSKTFTYNMIMIIFALGGAIASNYDYFIKDYQGVLLCIVLFGFIFALSSLIKKIILYKKEGRKLHSVSSALLFVFCGLGILTGNYFASVKTLMVDSRNSIIVADYKDKVVKIKCNEDGERQIIVSPLDDNNLRVIPNDYFKRDWLVGKCIKEKESVNIVPLFV